MGPPNEVIEEKKKGSLVFEYLMTIFKFYFGGMNPIWELKKIFFISTLSTCV